MLDRVDISQIDGIFDTIAEVNKHKPDEWRNSIIQQLTKADGIEEFRKFTKLKAIVQNFVVDQQISCPETIYQTDWVIQNAYEFIEELVNIVGYYEYDDDN